jgi:hypothetical protein
LSLSKTFDHLYINFFIPCSRGQAKRAIFSESLVKGGQTCLYQDGNVHLITLQTLVKYMRTAHSWHFSTKFLSDSHTPLERGLHVSLIHICN